MSYNMSHKISKHVVVVHLPWQISKFSSQAFTVTPVVHIIYTQMCLKVKRHKILLRI